MSKIKHFTSLYLATCRPALGLTLKALYSITMGNKKFFECPERLSILNRPVRRGDHWGRSTPLFLAPAPLFQCFGVQNLTFWSNSTPLFRL